MELSEKEKVYSAIEKKTINSEPAWVCTTLEVLVIQLMCCDRVCAGILGQRYFSVARGITSQIHALYVMKAVTVDFRCEVDHDLLNQATREVGPLSIAGVA